MIELSNLEKRFGDNVVLKDINVAMKEGSVTALVGPSGALQPEFGTPARGNAPGRGISRRA